MEVMQEQLVGGGGEDRDTIESGWRNSGPEVFKQTRKGPCE